MQATRTNLKNAAVTIPELLVAPSFNTAWLLQWRGLMERTRVARTAGATGGGAPPIPANRPLIGLRFLAHEMPASIQTVEKGADMKTEKNCIMNCADSRVQRGFTLIELMIIVAIVGILTFVAVPSYRQYVVKSNRAAAESFIMSVTNKQEQYILDARQYAATLALLGMAVPADVSRNYNITITNIGATPPTYTITAVPVGSQAASDTRCGSVSIDQAGTKGITGTATAAECW